MKQQKLIDATVVFFSVYRYEYHLTHLVLVLRQFRLVQLLYVIVGNKNDEEWLGYNHGHNIFNFVLYYLMSLWRCFSLVIECLDQRSTMKSTYLQTLPLFWQRPWLRVSQAIHLIQVKKGIYTKMYSQNSVRINITQSFVPFGLKNKRISSDNCNY